MACHNDPQRYRVPSKSAFSRFNSLMNRAERDCGTVSDMFDSLVKRISQLLPDFGTHQVFDGKALESRSTGNDIPGKGETSDADARWGKHEYHYTDQKGRPLIGISAMVRILSVQVHQELTSISIFCSYICSLSSDDDMHS